MPKINLQTVSLTGSKKLDIVIFIIMVLLILRGSSRLKVYYKVNAIRVEATRILSDGSRAPLKIPEHLRRSGKVHGRMEKRLKVTEHRIRRYMEKNIKIEQMPAGDRYEWMISYSINSPSLDQKKILNFPK